MEEREDNSALESADKSMHELLATNGSPSNEDLTIQESISHLPPPSKPKSTTALEYVLITFLILCTMTFVAFPVYVYRLDGKEVHEYQWDWTKRLMNTSATVLPIVFGIVVGRAL